MNSHLLKTNYNSEIKIYHQGNLPCDLAQKTIDFIWLNNNLSSNNDDFKLIQESKAKVYRLKFNDDIYYIKSYAFRSPLKIFKNLFRPVEALRCFKTAIQLNNAHLAVFEPVLALTKRRNILSTDSIFITKEVPGLDLRTYLFSNNNMNDLELREKIIKKIAFIWSSLINYNFVHLDPCLNNLIVSSPIKEDLQIQIIDVDNMYRLPFLPKKLVLLKNLARLRNRFRAFSPNDFEIDLFIKEFCKMSPTYTEPYLRSLVYRLNNKS